MLGDESASECFLSATGTLRSSGESGTFKIPTSEFLSTLSESKNSSQVSALQQEVSRIMHENNQLHAALLQSNEATAKQQQRMVSESKEMEVRNKTSFLILNPKLALAITEPDLGPQVREQPKERDNPKPEAGER